MREIPTDRLCLVVGVTGHRDIAKEDEAPLRVTFGNVLSELERTCPHTPLLVLSGLAAGADSLAAEEAIARGIPVIACLPMPVEEYEHDFSHEDLARFRSLLAACARVTVTSHKRENGYVATGLFIAQYSHLLVAFWDGDQSRGSGGTADVVHMRMTPHLHSPGGVSDIPYLPDLGPVYHIVTPRASGTRPADAYALKRLYPRRFPHDDTVEQDFDTILARIDLYNTDLSRTGPKLGEAGLLALMERTDRTANRLQKHTNFFQMLLFAVAFAAATVQIMTGLPSILKVVGILAAFAAYGLARKNDYENRYQDYRALAEGLRVQSAWYCAGLRHQLVDKAYLRMQEGDLQWIRMALRCFYLIYCEDHELSGASHDHPVCQDWISSQWSYYRTKSRALVGSKRTLDRIGMAALALGILSTIVSAVVIGRNLPCALLGAASRYCASHVMPPETLTYLLTVPVAMAAILGALFSHYTESQNIEGNARRYERMFHIFDNARQQLLNIEQGHPGKPREIILALGREALIEHADWLIARRERPMKVVMV